MFLTRYISEECIIYKKQTCMFYIIYFIIGKFKGVKYMSKLHIFY